MVSPSLATNLDGSSLEDHLKACEFVVKTLEGFRTTDSLMTSPPFHPSPAQLPFILELLWVIQRREPLLARISRALLRLQIQLSFDAPAPVTPTERLSVSKQFEHQRRVHLAQLTVLWMRIAIERDMSSDVEHHPQRRFSFSQRLLRLHFSLAPSDYHRTTPRPYLSRLLVTPSGMTAFTEAANEFREIWLTLSGSLALTESQRQSSVPPPQPFNSSHHVCKLFGALGLSQDHSSTPFESIMACFQALSQQTIDWTLVAHTHAVNLISRASLLQNPSAHVSDDLELPISPRWSHKTSSIAKKCGPSEQNAKILAHSPPILTIHDPTHPLSYNDTDRGILPDSHSPFGTVTPIESQSPHPIEQIPHVGPSPLASCQTLDDSAAPTQSPVAAPGEQLQLVPHGPEPLVPDNSTLAPTVASVTSVSMESPMEPLILHHSSLPLAESLLSSCAAEILPPTQAPVEKPIDMFDPIDRAMLPTCSHENLNPQPKFTEQGNLLGHPAGQIQTEAVSYLETSRAPGTCTLPHPIILADGSPDSRNLSLQFINPASSPNLVISCAESNIGPHLIDELSAKDESHLAPGAMEARINPLTPKTVHSCHERERSSQPPQSSCTLAISNTMLGHRQPQPTTNSQGQGASAPISVLDVPVDSIVARRFPSVLDIAAAFAVKVQSGLPAFDDSIQIHGPAHELVHSSASQNSEPCIAMESSNDANTALPTAIAPIHVSHLDQTRHGERPRPFRTEFLPKSAASSSDQASKKRRRSADSFTPLIRKRSRRTSVMPSTCAPLTKDLVNKFKANPRLSDAFDQAYEMAVRARREVGKISPSSDLEAESESEPSDSHGSGDNAVRDQEPDLETDLLDKLRANAAQFKQPEESYLAKMMNHFGKSR